MNRVRLEKLANYLDTLNPGEEGEFDLSQWVRPSKCGFAGCAIGWALHAELFKEEGLKWFDVIPSYSISNDKEHLGFDAVEEFFGLSAAQARFIFYDGSYGEDNVEPKDAAARIREVMNSA